MHFSQHFQCSAPEALDDAAPVLTLCPAALPLDFSPFIQPDNSVRCWLISALPLVLAPGASESLTVPVSPAVVPVLAEVTEAAPVLKKTRKPKNTEETAQDKNPRRRSQRAAAQ